MATEPLRVLRIITRLNIGGPAREIAALCRGGAEHDAKTVLAAGRPGRDEGDGFEALDLGGADRVRIPGLGRAPGVTADVRAAFALVRLARAFRPHVIHTHTSKAGLLGRLAAAAVGGAIACHTYHGHAFTGHFGPIVSGLLTATERWLAHRTDAVIALGPRGGATLRRLGIGRRVEIIPPGFDPTRLAGLQGVSREEARRSLGLDGSEPVLLAFGRLAPVKGIDLLLEAIARAGPAAGASRLLLAGDGPARAALEDRAGRLGLGSRVRFLGWRDDPARLFAAADLLVVPSHSEGYPHAVVEARAAGCPVLATRVGEIPDLVDEGRTGRLVPPGRIEALADALAGLLVDPATLAALRRGSTETAPAVRDEAWFTHRTFALYRELRASCGGAGEGSGP